MNPITVPRGVSRPSSSGSAGAAAGVADGAVAAAGASGVACAFTNDLLPTLNASNRAHIFGNARIEFVANLCISACVKKAQAGIVSSRSRVRKSTSCLHSFLETLACRGGIPEMLAVLTQQELVRHPRNVVADRDGPRFRTHQLLMRGGHRARRMQIILK